MRSIPASQQGLTLRDFRKMEYLSQVCSVPIHYLTDDACKCKAGSKIIRTYGLTDETLCTSIYLNVMKVIDETLRLVNISFVSFRQATKDVFVNGTAGCAPFSNREVTYFSFREVQCII